MDLFSLLDEIQTIARNGLNYTSNAYDLERYERLMKLATMTYGELLDVSDDAIRTRFLRETGHITPKVGSDAGIFDEGGKILLMDRSDGSGWCLPCGWLEPNEKPVEAVIREVREETGLKVEVKQLVGVFTRNANAENGPHTTVAIVHLCEVTGGELTLSHEGLALRYWIIDEVQNWFSTHERYARAAFKMWKSNHLLPAVSD